jgi:hypothetical protein
MACAGGFDDRRFALLAPTTARVMIRAHVGGIAKENLRFFPLRKGFNLRVFLLEPLLDQGLVALLRAVQRLLGRPYKSGQSRDWIKVKNPDSPAMRRAREGRW